MQLLFRFTLTITTLFVLLLLSACGGSDATVSVEPCSENDASCSFYCDLQPDNLAACVCPGNPNSASCSNITQAANCTIDPSQLGCSIDISILSPKASANLSAPVEIRLNFSAEIAPILDETRFALNDKVVTQHFRINANGTVAAAQRDLIEPYLKEGKNELLISLGGHTETITFLYDITAPYLFIRDFSQSSNGNGGTDITISGRVFDTSLIQSFTINDIDIALSDDSSTPLTFENEFSVTLSAPHPLVEQEAIIDPTDMLSELRPEENLDSFAFVMRDFHGHQRSVEIVRPGNKLRSQLFAAVVNTNPISDDFATASGDPILNIFEPANNSVEKRTACDSIFQTELCDFLLPSNGNPQVWLEEAETLSQPSVVDPILSTRVTNNGIDSNVSSAVDDSLGGFRIGSNAGAPLPFIFDGAQFRIYSVALGIPIDLLNQYLHTLNKDRGFIFNLPAQEILGDLATDLGIAPSDEVRLIIRFNASPYLTATDGTASLTVTNTRFELTLAGDNVSYSLSRRSTPTASFTELLNFTGRFSVPIEFSANFTENWTAGSDWSQSHTTLIENQASLPYADFSEQVAKIPALSSKIAETLSIIIPGNFLEPVTSYNPIPVAGFNVDVLAVATTGSYIVFFLDPRPR